MSEDTEREQGTDATPERPGFFARLFRRRRAVEHEVEQTAVEPAAVESEPSPEPAPVAEATPDPEPAPAPVAEAAPAPAPLATDLTVESPAIVAPEPDAPLTISDERAPEPTDEPDEPAFDEAHVTAVLEGVLDDLGAAHHRPFSRG